MNKEDLTKAAKDLNKVLDPDPPIDTRTSEEELQESVVQASDLLETGDKIQASTAKVLEELSVKLDKGVEVEGAVAEEKKTSSRRPAPKKEEKKTSSRKPAPKKEEKKPAPRTPAKKKEPVDRSKSNKAVIYRAWKGGTKDIEKLHKLVKGAVKLSTVKTWTNWWKNGINFPSIAKNTKRT